MWRKGCVAFRQETAGVRQIGNGFGTDEQLSNVVVDLQIGVQEAVHVKLNALDAAPLLLGIVHVLERQFQTTLGPPRRRLGSTRCGDNRVTAVSLKERWVCKNRFEAHDTIGTGLVQAVAHVLLIRNQTVDQNCGCPR